MQILLNTEHITATFQDGVLTIEATGHADGIRGPRVILSPTQPGGQSGEQPFPLVYQVVADPSPAIGMFPYEARGEFPMDGDPVDIEVETASGIQDVHVRLLTTH